MPTPVRRFVGVWVSDKGFVNTNRQFMLAVTHVERQGLAGGWTVRGPPAPNSRIQNPAEAVPITAFISDDGLSYTNPRGDYTVWFADHDGLVFKQKYITGDTTMVALEPVWTLLGAERKAANSAGRSNRFAALIFVVAEILRGKMLASLCRSSRDYSPLIGAALAIRHHFSIQRGTARWRLGFTADKIAQSRHRFDDRSQNQTRRTYNIGIDLWSGLATFRTVAVGSASAQAKIVQSQRPLLRRTSSQIILDVVEGARSGNEVP